MVNFTFAIAVGVIDTIINNPERIHIWVNIYHRDSADTPDNSLGITTPLPTRRFDFRRIVLISGGIVKQQITVIRKADVVFDVFPDFSGGNSLVSQVAVDLVMTPLLGVVSKVSLCVIDVADQQELAIIQLKVRLVSSECYHKVIL